MKRVLLLRPGGLGDLVITLPSIRLLRRLYPGAPLHLAARADYAALFAAAGVVDRVFDLDDRAWTPLFSENPAAAGPLPGGPTAAVWSWFLKPPPSLLSGTLAALAPGGTHILAADPRLSLPLNRDFFERTAAAAGARVGGGDFEECSRLPAVRPQPERPFAGGFAVVHPGSGGRKKRWPLERFRDLIGVLSGRGVPGLLVTGPAEADEDPSSARIPLPTGWQRRPSPPLIDLAAWLSACRLYIGNDSGVTHLAAAAGAPTLAFFLDENLPAWRPCGRTAVLQAGRIGEISSAEARESLLARLAV
jgi:heptosyltransferase III